MAGMYTKMTASGSSLIVAPRTISKELEAKISAAIARVIAKHDAAQLTTKMVRQAVEKDVHVSLSNHKEVLKRLMHQEFRRVKAEKAAKRAEAKPWKFDERQTCIVKGLHRLYALAREEETFGQVGLHTCRVLQDLRAIEAGDVARLAATYMRMLAARWIKLPQRLEWPRDAVPTPQQVAHAVESVYTVERLGLSHDSRMQVHQFLTSPPKRYGAVDYFGWDPASGPPVSTAGCSAFQQMTSALELCWFAYSLQHSIGCTFSQLLQHLPVFYPYKGPNELSASEYRDQVHMVTTLVLVLSRFGSLRCEPELLLHEYYFLRQHLVCHIVRQDVFMVAEMLRALRCFDGSDNLVSVRRGMALIMLTQSADGSWSNEDGKPRFQVVSSAICALIEPQSCGVAPSIPEIVPLLQLHLNADLPFLVAEPDTPDTEVSVDKAPSPTQDSVSSSGESVATSSQKALASSPTADGDKVDTPASANEEEDIETQVRFLQGMLEKDGDNVKTVSAALATHVLSTLSSMTLNVDILKTTGIGRVINKLRKHNSESVATAAAKLVQKWKKALL